MCIRDRRYAEVDAAIQDATLDFLLAQHFRVEHVGGKSLDDARRQVPQGSGRAGADAQGASTALRFIDGVLEQLYLVLLYTSRCV